MALCEQCSGQCDFLKSLSPQLDGIGQLYRAHGNYYRWNHQVWILIERNKNRVPEDCPLRYVEFHDISLEDRFAPSDN